jgi:hypothetical protein
MRAIANHPPPDAKLQTGRCDATIEALCAPKTRSAGRSSIAATPAQTPSVACEPLGRLARGLAAGARQDRNPRSLD